MYLSGLEQTRIMTISSGVMANANLRYGKPDLALKQICGTMKTFGRYLVGSHSEMSPDYGCFVQGWTSYVMLSPIITGFMGIEPDAARKTVVITPQLPSDWEYGKIKRLKVGTNEIDVQVKRAEKGYVINVYSRELEWTFKSEYELYT
jgi:glycogen debranching enzyme